MKAKHLTTGWFMKWMKVCTGHSGPDLLETIFVKIEKSQKTFKMQPKVLTHLNFVYNSSKNDRNNKIVHTKVTCEVIVL